jgi:transposase InsO family protein
MRHSFGAFGQGVANGLKLRHDHGSQFVSEAYQNELKYLGILSSPTYVREPQGSGAMESPKRFIRILKENLLWVRYFDTVEELRQALLDFKETYNRQWIVVRHGL